jgi:hypothetical protein
MLTEEMSSMARAGLTYPDVAHALGTTKGTAGRANYPIGYARYIRSTTQQRTRGGQHDRPITIGTFPL